MAKENLTETIRQLVPLAATLGMTARSLQPELVELSLDWSPQLCTANGALHGGVLMSLADTAGAACAFYNLPEDATGTATIESKTNFLRPVTGGTVVARATPIHLGSSTVVVETELVAEQRLVAKTIQTQALLR